ncbi:MAG: hypothetical protein ISR76_06490 [Planctomycetes bacterium]|nr:hypothetical protein [Planctomycetota bacterium]MBL7008628.1 hypothetical protein [Planctomycetota bacterium]
MTVQPDRPDSPGLLTIAVSGSIITLVVAYLAAAAFHITTQQQTEAKRLARDVSPVTELRAAQRADLSGIEAAMSRVVSEHD